MSEFLSIVNVLDQGHEFHICSQLRKPVIQSLQLLKLSKMPTKCKDTSKTLHKEIATLAVGK